jgi:hypothetical protein
MLRCIGIGKVLNAKRHSLANLTRERNDRERNAGDMSPERRREAAVAGLPFRLMRGRV